METPVTTKPLKLELPLDQWEQLHRCQDAVRATSETVRVPKRR